LKENEMTRRFLPPGPLLAAALFLAVVAGHEAMAHGGGNWEPFTIDGVNDSARGRVIEVQALMSEIIRGRAGKDVWPLASFRETHDALMTVKEEVDEVLEHYVTDGVNVQNPAVLHAEPRVGRTAAASRALAAALALVDRAGALDSADAFVAEFYAGGVAAQLYELLEAHGDRMDLYAALTSAGE
jgi:hypothetical protein